MAEFQTVLRETARMCKTQRSCCNCPMAAIGYRRLCELSGARIEELTEAGEEMETAVMSWAKEHPAPRYPSWYETWKQLFPEARENTPPCPKYMLSNERYSEMCDEYDLCEDCRKQPIPADIAEKLGIKPIGGEGQDD